MNITPRLTTPQFICLLATALASLFFITHPGIAMASLEMSARTVSSDGTYISVGFNTGRVLIIDAKQGQIVSQLENVNDDGFGVSNMAFLPNSDLILLSDWDNRLMLWNWRKQRKLAETKTAEKAESIVISTDGDLIGVMSDEGWEVFNRKLKKRRGPDQRYRSDVFWSPDKTKFALSGYGQEGEYLIAIHSASDFKQQAVVSMERWIDSLTLVNNNASLIVSGSEPVSLWNIETGTQTKILGDERIEGFTLLPNGDQLLTYRANTLSLVDISDGRRLKQRKLANKFRIRSVDLIGGGMFLVEGETGIASFERKALLFKDFDAKPLEFKTLKPQGTYNPLVINSQSVLFGSSYPAELWNLRTAKLEHRIFQDALSAERTLLQDINLQQPKFSMGSNVNSMSYDSQHRLLVGSEEFPLLSIIDKEGRFEALLSVPDDFTASQVDFIDDGQRAVVNSVGKGVEVWDLQSQKKLHNFHFESGPQSYALSADQTKIAISSSVGEILIASLDDYKTLHRFDLNRLLKSDDSEYVDFESSAMLWLSDGDQLLISSDLGLIKIGIRGGELSVLFEEESKALLSFKNASNETRIAVGFEDGPVKLLNQSLSMVGSLAHEGVIDMAYDPRTESLFTLTAYSNDDGANDLRAWNLKKNRSRLCFQRDEEWLSQIAYDTNTSTLMVADSTGEIHRLQWRGKCITER